MKKTLLMSMIAVCFLLVGCSDSSSVLPSNQKIVELPTIKVGYLNKVSLSIPLFIAQDKKFFEEQGIKVEAVMLDSSNMLLEALVRGDVDAAAPLSLLPILNSELKDPGKIKVTAHSTLTKDNAYASFVVTSGSQIHSIQDFVGKKIGVYPGNSTTVLGKQLMKKYNITLDGMEFIQLPPAQHIQALDQGAVDVLFALQPNLAIALSDGNHRVVFTGIIEDLYDKTPVGVAAVNTQYATQYPDVVNRWTAAMDQAYDYQVSHPEDSKSIAGKAFGFGTGVLPYLTLFNMTKYESMDLVRVQDYIKRLISVGELSKSIDVNNIVYKK